MTGRNLHRISPRKEVENVYPTQDNFLDVFPCIVLLIQKSSPPKWTTTKRGLCVWIKCSNSKISCGLLILPPEIPWQVIRNCCNLKLFKNGLAIIKLSNGFYFYFLRCSITRDDYTSARTDKIKHSKLIKYQHVYTLYIISRKLEFVTLDQSFELIQRLTWYDHTVW